MTHVAAAILEREGRLLICKRGAGGSTAHLWEFPGGKLEPGETPEECVVRECREELDAEIRPLAVYETTSWRYPDREIAFTFFRAALVSGEPRRIVHDEIRWVAPCELPDYPFCPADRALVERLAREGQGEARA